MVEFLADRCDTAFEPAASRALRVAHAKIWQFTTIATQTEKPQKPGTREP